MKLTTMERISLKNSKDIKEKMIQDYICDNPACLGLGDLTVVTREKAQPSGGRLELLLADDDKTIYEVEIQLGETDPSHIIRTIEYWDTERKRYQRYDHVAVIVAEDLSSRYLNVIQLFNGSIPVIALQLTAYKQGDGNTALIFTKVLETVVAGTEEEDELEPTDREYWENKSTSQQLLLVDEMLKSEVFRGFEPKYNEFYIGLTKDGLAKNFVAFRPRKNFTYISYYKIKNPEEFTERLENAGISYDTFAKNNEIRVVVNNIREYNKNKELLNEMFKWSKDEMGC